MKPWPHWLATCCGAASPYSENIVFPTGESQPPIEAWSATHHLSVSLALVALSPLL